MKWPAFNNDARTHIYYCAKCAVYVHEKCWNEHVAQAHKE